MAHSLRGKFEIGRVLVAQIFFIRRFKLILKFSINTIILLNYLLFWKWKTLNSQVSRISIFDALREELFIFFKILIFLFSLYKGFLSPCVFIFKIKHEFVSLYLKIVVWINFHSLWVFSLNFVLKIVWRCFTILQLSFISYVIFKLLNIIYVFLINDFDVSAILKR